MKRFFLIAAVVAGLFCVSNVDTAEAGRKNGGSNFQKNSHGGGHKNFSNNNRHHGSNKHFSSNKHFGGNKHHNNHNHHNNHFNSHNSHNGHFHGGYNKPYYNGGGYGYGGGYGGYGKGVTINTPGFSFGIYK
ncbi:hypothetical protein Pla110_07310 [Polystyrenella longa]|uniref:Pentapeptide repeats (8 copies) n=1 Tax=Polystyrenella longa TaxID=2528007 RepID=A0A518CIL0_9PLAN|nr:hypothetical protein [Polystyrenella longa]QDU79027.1 hypothetical protein Pla110_07310 [Polystyrenella longa]